MPGHVDPAKGMSMSNLINKLPIDSNRIAQLIVVDEIDPAVDVFANWSRVIAGAPIESKPALFGMMARDAAVTLPHSR
jgi:hypothetical protein